MTTLPPPPTSEAWEPGPELTTVEPVRPAAVAAPGAGLETWIGRYALGWVAAILLLFAGGFFLKQVFENRWVGELGRIAIGILFGSGLCALGLRLYRRLWPALSQMATASGLGLLYLVTYAGFGYYHLVPQQRAFIFLVILVLEGAALAILYNAPAIALMSVIGGLLTPVLFRSDFDQYRGLFTYLSLLNAGIVGLVVSRRWWGTGAVGLLGTHLLFWLWYWNNYHPEKLAWAIGFQVVVFSLYLGSGFLISVLHRSPAHAEELARFVANALLFATAGYVLLDDFYHYWMGSLALGLAIVYAGYGWLLSRIQPDDPPHLLAAVAVAMALVAAVFPLHAAANWIAVGWAVEGAMLWWFGLRVRAPSLTVLGAVLLVLAAARTVFVDTPSGARPSFVPLLNSYGLPAAIVAACLAAATWAARRFRPRLGVIAPLAVGGLGLVTVGFIWFLLSVESYTYVLAQTDARGFGRVFDRLAHAVLSGVWALYAAAILGLGFSLGSAPLRWGALGIFSVTLLKVISFDMAELPGLYRAATFLVLAMTLALGAWAYHRFQVGRPTPSLEERGHEAASEV